MQREIIFRGKWIGNEKWIQGNLARFSNGDCAICNMDSVDEEPLYYLVDPDTVGQYTGLTDKNNEKIFEGDIAEVDDEEGYFEVIWDSEAAMFILNGDGLQVHFDYLGSLHLTVIGNIYDNPELMEEDGDD